MTCGIGAVDARGKYRDRVAALDERRPVYGAFDTVGSTGDESLAVPGQLAGDVLGNVHAVSGRRPGASDRDKRALLRLMQIPAGSR